MSRGLFRASRSITSQSSNLISSKSSFSPASSIVHLNSQKISLQQPRELLQRNLHLGAQVPRRGEIDGGAEKRGLPVI